ncbi:MAG: RagB/SusD family nutrient uptake outer membrane protein [Bacteroidales bacterium]|nr:RagB/SusD family nutrient uptake outer membrane protein [Bacteroidales bacterium]
METKKISRLFAIIALPLFFLGCAKFTDITPKGASLLDRVEDLELLLNHESRFGGLAQSFEPVIFVNDLLPRGVDILRLINDHEAGHVNAMSILVTWDESIDRSTVLNSSRTTYDAFYRIIGTIANPILLKIDDATGSRERANQIKAEALVLRAYMHYLAVNLYARAYNPATAATDGGIPYMFETDYHDLTANMRKRTVREVYDFILADLDAALALNSLPLNPLRIRVGKAFAHAVRAKVLMAVRDFDGAYEAATRSLEINSSLLDFRGSTQFSRPAFNPEELFSIFETFTGTAFTPDLLQSFAPNDVFLNHGSLERNLPFPFNFNIRSGEGVSRVIGSTGWMHNLWIGLPYCNFIPNSVGLSTVDMFLTQAEVHIRRGNPGAAMAILEMLRQRRTLDGEHDPLPANPIEALQLVSRHENFASLRNFINLKRWNTEPEWATTLTRTLRLAAGGFFPPDPDAGIFQQPLDPIIERTYVLRPDSPLWIFPFPQSATNFNPYLTPNH